MGINWEKLDAGLDALSAEKQEEQKKNEGRAFVFPVNAPKAKSETTGQVLPYQDVEEVGTAFDEPEELMPRENGSVRAKVSNAIDELSFGDMFDALGNARDKNVLADALEENAEASGAYIEGAEKTQEAEAYEEADREAEKARTAAMVAPFQKPARSFIAENADDPASRWQEAAQGLRRSSANLAYFMTPDEKLTMAREVSQFTGIPANKILESDEAYKSALSVYDYAKKRQAIADAEGDDFSIEDIYKEFPGLDKIVKNDPQGAALALSDIHNIRSIRDGITAASKGFSMGAKSLEANLLSWKDMKGEATSEDKKKLAELQKEMAQDEFILPSIFEDPATAIIGASAESLPLMLYTFAEAGKEGVRDAAIYGTAAMAVSAATGPGAMAGAAGGVSAGFIKGFGSAFLRTLMQSGGRRALSLGMKAGMFGANARPMMGEDFAKYKEIPGVSRDEARGLAVLTGGVKALIETWSDLNFANLSLRPYTKTVLKEHIGAIIGTAKESIKSTGSKVASAIGRYAADATKEQLGEMTEEAAQNVTDDLAANYIAETYHVGEKLSGQEMAMNALQSFLYAAPASFGLTMGGSVVGAPGRAWNYRASRAQTARWERLSEKHRETLAGTLMLDRLQGEVEASKLKDTAPDVQQQLIREELKETPWQMAHVDTGLVLSQEGGREDVEALGKAAGLSEEEIAQTIEEEGWLHIPTEIYAQTKTSPAALNATTFSEDAEPMAKMKERAAQYAEEIQRETNTAIEKQINLIEGVADMLFPGDKELRDEALVAIYEDPENPAQGWKSIMGRLTAARDEILAPAMKALNEGMGQGTSVVDTVNEQGEVQTGRVSNNAEWYRRFYAEYGRKPKAQEMIDLARDLTFALPGAPEVEGWRVTTAEDEEAMRQGYEEYQKIEKEIEQLNAIKERMGTLTKGELDVIQGMSKEGYEVYRNLQSEVLEIGGEPAKAAKMNALLIARHAEVAAAVMRRRGYENYTAMDYYRDNLSVVGEDVEAPKRGVMEQAEMNRQKEEVRKKYEGTDRWMKAPNGEQTNLTEDQWLTVRTDAFKNWFGDWENDPGNASKVVDENGEPLVVYHGSDADFDVFDASKSRANMDIQGNFFTPWELDAQGYGENVRAFFLNIKNPADSGRGYKALNSFKGQNGAGVKARDALVNEGFDGVNNDDEEYIAFEPTQIKSATDNNGQFLVDDPNVYHQEFEKQDERLAGKESATAKWGDKENKIADSIDNTLFFRHFGSKTRKEFNDDKEYIKSSVLRDANILRNEGKPVERDKLYTINELIDYFNELSPKDKYNRLMYAAQIEWARRCFENDEAERQQQRLLENRRDSSDAGRGTAEFDENGSSLVGGQSTGNVETIKRTQTVIRSVIVDAEKDDAKKVWNEAVDEERAKRGLPSIAEQNKAQAQSRSENQGGFSDGQILNQDAGKVTRGRIWRDRRQGKKIIQLLSTADRSTFLHEMGHLFLMDLEDLAAMGDEESQRMLDEVDDWAKWQGKGDAKKYAGTAWAKEFTDREAAILEADRAGDLLGRDALIAQWRQERFARAWEVYLMEGTAPSKGLRAVFRKFKSWLRKIYNVFISDGARASKDVEKVMARLIASEEEIERMEADARYTNFEAAGGKQLLKEDAKQTFARWQEEAREEAKTKIRREIMKDLKGKREEEWAGEMAGARAQIEEELRNQPIYLARRAIEESGDPAMWKIFFNTKEEFEEADKAPSLEDEVAMRLDEYERNADKSRLDAEIKDADVEEALSSAHWHERLIELETQAFAKKLALTQTFGEKQQNAVERLEAAIEGMEETDTLQGEETEKERFKAAQKAVTSLKVSGRWNKEMYKIIQRMENAQTKKDFAEGLKDFREAKKEQEKLSKKDFDTANEGEVEDTRRRAKEALAKMKLPEATMHATFRQHEREAAKRAEKMVKAKRWDVAMICKRQQLYASMCAAEARKIAERAQKLRDRVKKQIESKVQLPKDEGYWLAHLAYVLRIVDNDVEKPEGLQSLAAIGKQMTDGLDVLGDEDGHNELTALLLKYTDTESKEGWRGMTIGELEDAVEALNMLHTIGRDKFKMKTMQGKHIEEVRAEMLSDDTSYNAARVSSPRITGNDNTGGLFWNDWIAKIPMVGGKLAKTMQWYGVSLTKPEEMIRLLGEKAHRYIYGTYDRAMAEECKETARVMKKLDEILGKYSRAERQTWQDRVYEFNGEKLSKENILAMALHLGTESNRQRLAQGMFSMAEIQDMGADAREINANYDWMDIGLPRIISFIEENMTEKDWAFVQGVWDIFKEQWPKTVETEMKLNGRRLKPLEVLPFTARTKGEDGEIKEIRLLGGYCPVRYDPEKSTKAGEQAENDIAKQQMSGAMVFGMNRYFTHERVESVMERPLLLSLSIIPSHLMAAIHNNTYRLAARDVYRLINDGEVRRRIESTMGMDAYKVLRKWATDNWAMAPGTDNIAERGITSRLAYIRRNAGLAIMGFRLWPMVENATNIFPMMDRLGVSKTMTALSDFYANMKEGRELLKKSVFMMQRAEHMDRDFRQQRDMFEAKGAAAEWLTEHAYTGMELTDLAGSAPLWVHTYKNAFGGKYREVEEENKENIRKLEEARAARDEIAASYHDKRMAAKDIEAELEDRKYIRMPKPGNPLGGIKTSELRAELANLKHELQEMKREVAKANGELERASGLLFLTNDEIVSEAERRSVAIADEAVRDVFGSGDVKDLAEIQKGGELSKMLTAFYSYFNAQANAVLRSHWRGKWKERNLMPLGRTIFFRFILTSMLATAGKMLLVGDGNDDKDKYRKRADGTKEEVPILERALKEYGKNLLSTAVGGMYGVRDVASAAINLMFDGTDYGRGISMGGVSSRIFEQTWQEVKLIRAKAERDEKERIAEEKRRAKYDKMTRRQKAAFDEKQKYRKPPATISYADLLRGAGSIGTSLTAARTGITEPITNAVLGTMQYLTDSDGRYEATMKNMLWSALWTKKPVRRTPPEKQETPEERRRRERKERRKKK